MNEILEAIQNRVRHENLCTSCEESGCKASMDGVPYPRVLVNANKAFTNHRIEGKRCDCILFFMNSPQDTLIAVPIELKGDHVNVTEAYEQLQQGANFVNCFAPTSFNSDCQPILFHNSGIHPTDRKKLNRAKVQFRGIGLTIKTARCDRPNNLANILKK